MHSGNAISSTAKSRCQKNTDTAGRSGTWEGVCHDDRLGWVGGAVRMSFNRVRIRFLRRDKRGITGIVTTYSLNFEAKNIIGPCPRARINNFHVLKLESPQWIELHWNPSHLFSAPTILEGGKVIDNTGIWREPQNLPESPPHRYWCRNELTSRYTEA